MSFVADVRFQDSARGAVINMFNRSFCIYFLLKVSNSMKNRGTERTENPGRYSVSYHELMYETLLCIQLFLR